VREARLVSRLAWFLVGFAAAVVVMLFVGPAWSGVVEYSFPEVIVTQAELEDREPPAEPTIIERVVYRNIPPAQAARAPGGAAELVSSFCRPVTVATTDTVEVVDTLFLARSGEYSEPGLFTPWRPSRLQLTGPTSAGDLLELTFHPRGSHDWRSDPGEVRVREYRAAFARDAFETVATYWTLFSAVYLGLELIR